MAFDVITIGSATRDVFLRSGDLIMLRSDRFRTGVGECISLGSKVEIGDILFTIGGSASNTAVTFARRGFRAAIVAKVGNDIRGEEIIRTLAEERVQTKFIAKDPDRMSPYAIVILAPSGERSILVYRGAGEELAARDVPFRRLRAEWLYITHLGGKSAAFFPKILRYARETGARVAVNPGKTQLRMPLARLRPLLNLIDVLILNREEGSYLTKIPYEREDAIFQKLDDWVRGLVVMTDGPGGVTVSDGRTRWHGGILKERRRVDRTGAGDAFGSGFVAGLMERMRAWRDGGKEYGAAVPYAMQLGSANATSVLEQVGAQPGILRKRDSMYRWGKLRIVKSKIQSPNVK